MVYTVLRQTRTGEKPMKTITMALQKGGTGKTSTAVTLAAELAKVGKTLLIDADPQGNATTWIAGNSVQAELADVLNGKKEAKDVLQATSVKGLYIIPTAGLGGDLREYQKTKAPGAPYAIADMLEPLRAFFDYCIIDTSPSFDPLNESVFMASDEILTVLQFNEFSKDGFSIFINNLRDARKRLHIPPEKAKQNKIILNAKDDRIKQQQDVLLTLQQLEADGYALHIIPVDQAFNKAQSMHVAIQDLSTTKKETLQAIEGLAEAVR